MQKLGADKSFREMFAAADFAEKRVLADDEYIDGETHLIVCKKCNTSRQHWIDGRGWMYLNCKCREAERLAADEKTRVAVLAEKLRAQAFDGRTEYKNHTFANSVNSSEAMFAAKRFVDNFAENKKRGIGLMFWGGVGTGKTYLAASIANALIDVGEKVMVVTAAGIVRKSQAKFYETNPFEEYQNCSLVIFDDFGAERDTSTAVESVCSFIDFCQSRKISMVVTTNFTPQLMAETGANDTGFARMADRISATCYPVKVDGNSFREKQKREMCKIMREQLGLKN